MGRIVLAIIAGLALLAAISLSPNRAEAAAMPVPSGIQALTQDNSMIEEAAYVCRRVWRCGAYGCGWRRVCEYISPRFYRPYRPYRYYRW
jgi:hypothetical protein